MKTDGSIDIQKYAYITLFSSCIVVLYDTNLQTRRQNGLIKYRTDAHKLLGPNNNIVKPTSQHIISCRI